MLKTALKNICSVRNRLFPLRVLADSWDSHRILQTAHKHERCVLFSFIWSCKTLCIYLTLSMFPINLNFPFHETLLSILIPSGCYISFLPVLLPTLNYFLIPSACDFPLLHCCSVENLPPNWPRGARGRSQAMRLSQCLQKSPWLCSRSSMPVATAGRCSSNSSKWS